MTNFINKYKYNEKQLRTASFVMACLAVIFFVLGILGSEICFIIQLICVLVGFTLDVRCEMAREGVDIVSITGYFSDKTERGSTDANVQDTGRD